MGEEVAAVPQDFDHIDQKLYLELLNALVPHRVGREDALQTLQRIVAERDAIKAKPTFGIRMPLPDKRRGYSQKVTIEDTTIHFWTGEYEDGRPGEIFMQTAKSGTAFRVLMSNFAIAVSVGLQHGVPLDVFVDAFVHSEFPPQGQVHHHDKITQACSLLDVVFRDLGITYLKRDDLTTPLPPRERL